MIWNLQTPDLSLEVLAVVALEEQVDELVLLVLPDVLVLLRMVYAAIFHSDLLLTIGGFRYFNL